MARPSRSASSSSRRSLTSCVSTRSTSRPTTRRRSTQPSSSIPRARRTTRWERFTRTATPGLNASRRRHGSTRGPATSSGAPPQWARQSRSGTPSSARGRVEPRSRCTRPTSRWSNDSISSSGSASPFSARCLPNTGSWRSTRHSRGSTSAASGTRYRRESLSTARSQPSSTMRSGSRSTTATGRPRTPSSLRTNRAPRSDPDRWGCRRPDTWSSSSMTTGTSNPSARRGTSR